jgi:hypothetical protein
MVAEAFQALEVGYGLDGRLDAFARLSKPPATWRRSIFWTSAIAPCSKIHWKVVDSSMARIP